MQVVDALGRWMASTELSWFVKHYGVWPIAEIFHFIGLALLVGISGAFDLRLLGFARQIPIRALNALMPWAVVGFVINAITGTMFVFGYPSRYLTNPGFQFKLAFILVAGLNVLVFLLVASRDALTVGPGEDAPRVAKVIAAISLVCWFAVMYCGRMLPYVGEGY